MFAWDSPSLGDNANLVSVLAAAPASYEQACCQDPLACRVDAAENRKGNEMVKENACGAPQFPNGTIPSRESRLDDSAGGTVLDVLHRPVDFDVRRPKRPAPPLLQFLDENGDIPKLEIGSLNKIVQCRPVPKISLHLGETLGAAKRVWKAIIRLLGRTVILKLFPDPKHLDNAPKDDLHEVCQNLHSLSESSTCRAWQLRLSTEIGAYESLALLQGTALPYSFGFYRVSF